MKFMHISDVHLGVKPDAGKAWSEKRAQDIWDSFAEMIEIAAEESPDFLLISGDLFHKQPLKRELKEVCGSVCTHTADESASYGRKPRLHTAKFFLQDM